MCVLCGVEEESEDDFMCKCPYVVGIWQSFLSLMGCVWVLDSRVERVISDWPGVPFVGEKGVAWKLILATILWALWKERNSRIFDGKSRNIGEVFEKAKWNLVG